MLNHIDLMGRLTRDPELRRTQSGVAVTTFRLAVERDIPDSQTGKRGADFIGCVAWRGRAEFVKANFTRGSMAIVTGRMRSREYTDKSEVKHSVLELHVDNIYFGEPKRRGQEDSPPDADAEFEEVDGDGDLPF